MSKIQNDTLVIIPTFNEEKNIGKVIDDLEGGNLNIDILVVNDGSFDLTGDIALMRNVFVISHPFNMGIGASFQSGCQFALTHGYKYIVRMDGDGQHDGSFIKTLLMPVINNEVDIVIGSRFLADSNVKTSFFRVIGISIIAHLLSAITRLKVTDPTSGFCAMNQKAYAFFSFHCPEDYPEPEIVVQHKNFRIKELPITMLKRQGGASSITPLKSIYYMFKVLFSLFVSIFRKE